MDLADSHVKPGITSLELGKIVHDASVERNSYPSPLGSSRSCLGMAFICCKQMSRRFHGDLNAICPVGKISEESEQLIKSTQACLGQVHYAERSVTSLGPRLHRLT
ncbi:hypothetical protein MJO28_009964 [Puccinia striiformis f. sp. tritici]|uniref:Uncharacterized protein n=1 Tax=Puccinia striiformis f. sp. tritici TaxID=168172 RepID=A0ACC0EAT0_9BASI|nr:hypothetical protein MJO28_009964 [Puccinia striiformis f. sp. tritici]